MPDKTLKEKDIERARSTVLEIINDYPKIYTVPISAAINGLEERVEELEKELCRERVVIGGLMAVKRENRKLQQEIKYLRKEARDGE